MENAKDTFYETMRSRLAGLNPARSVVIRGLVRPGLLVADNELPTEVMIPDAFTMRWTGLRVDAQGTLPLVALGCEFNYATDGSTGGVGMDRGRLLSAMDAELLAMVSGEPRRAVKMGYSGAVPVALRTQIFWGEPVFGAATVDGERVGRSVAVEVFCYQEAGEL